MFMHTHAYLCHFPKCININMHVFYITVILIFSLISAHSPPTPPIPPPQSYSCLPHKPVFTVEFGLFHVLTQVQVILGKNCVPPFVSTKWGGISHFSAFYSHLSTIPHGRPSIRSLQFYSFFA